jgi:hypothetical protein
MSAEQLPKPKKEVLSHIPDDVQTIDWTDVGEFEGNSPSLDPEELAQKASSEVHGQEAYEVAVKEPEAVKVQTEENLKAVLARLEENKIKWSSADKDIKDSVPESEQGKEKAPHEEIEEVKEEKNKEGHEHAKDKSETGDIESKKDTHDEKHEGKAHAKGHHEGGHGHEKPKPWGVKDVGTALGALAGGVGAGAALTWWGAPALASVIGIQTTIASSLATVGLTGFFWTGLGAAAGLGFLLMIAKAIYDERGKFPGMSTIGGGGKGAHAAPAKKEHKAAAPPPHH